MISWFWLYTLQHRTNKLLDAQYVLFPDIWFMTKHLCGTWSLIFYFYITLHLTPYSPYWIARFLVWINIAHWYVHAYIYIYKFMLLHCSVGECTLWNFAVNLLSAKILIRWKYVESNLDHVKCQISGMDSINHYVDVIMETKASQITSLTIPYSIVYSGGDQRWHQRSASLAICAGNSPVTGEFPAQMASNAENVSIWWRHDIVLSSNNLHQRMIQPQQSKLQ